MLKNTTYICILKKVGLDFVKEKNVLENIGAA
jgi:hypothetical protein